MSANNALHIAVLGGDGIGPEVMAPALEVLRRIEATTGPQIPLHRGAGRRQSLSRDRQVDAGQHDPAVRRGRRHPARRLRPAVGALSRQHRDRAADRAALHFDLYAGVRPARLIPGRAEPDRRRRRARHRSRRDPGIDRRPVRLDGQGRRHRTTRRARRWSITRKTSERLFDFSFRLAERRKARGKPGTLDLRRQGQRVQGVRLLSRDFRRGRQASSRTSRPTASMSMPAPRCW